MHSRRTFFLSLLVPIVRAARPAPLAAVVLLTANVAGYRHHGGPSHERRLRAGQRLRLVREPGNPYDRRAIAVDHPDGFRIGYVPRRHNDVPASLLDQGVALEARIVELRPYPEPPWRRVTVDIVSPRHERGAR